MKKSILLTPKGFTLIEMIVCLLLFGFLSVGVASYYAKSVEGYLLSTASSEACQKVNLAFERLAREIKNMDSVSSASSSSLCLNRGGAKFCFALSGSQLTLSRDSGAGWALIDGVTGFSVSLLDGNGNTWSPSGADNLSELARVEISMTLQIYDDTNRTFSIDINPLFNNTVNSAT